MKVYVLLLGILLGSAHKLLAQQPTDDANRSFLTYLAQYAESIGIDAPSNWSLASTAETTQLIRKLLTEIHYGRPPAFLSHQGLPEKIDTTLFQNAQKSWYITGSWQAPQSPFADSLLTAYRTHTHADTLRMLKEALNFQRWLHRFESERYAVVNIPAAELNVYDSQRNILLTMRVIVGKNTTQTPTMAAPVRDIVTYPYWNVPRSIATKEMLPKIKKNIGYLESQRLQVFGANGKAINPYSIEWSTLSASNFPYRLRQAAGCDNALGVIKFNLISPFDIYLHDTNQRSLFTRPNRWLSHGCIRVEKPIELANLLMGHEKYPENFLDICLKNQTPRTDKLETQFPVFVMYLPAAVDSSGSVKYYPDVYKRYRTK
jgi:hypothetical protein